MKSDRIFGAVVALVALAYIASAMQIQTSLLVDPVGPKTFPILIGGVACLSGIIVVLRPDESPEWPTLKTLLALLVAIIVLIAYAYTLKPLGFIIPTAITAAILSYQIHPNVKTAIGSGVGISIVLFSLFKFVLDLGLVAFPAGFGG